MISTFAVVVISRLGGRDFRIIEVVGLSLLLAALSAAIFFYGLRLPFNLWPV